MVVPEPVQKADSQLALLGTEQPREARTAPARALENAAARARDLADAWYGFFPFFEHITLQKPLGFDDCLGYFVRHVQAIPMSA